MIFDSAPGERRLTALFKAISAIIGGHPITNIPMSFFITIFLSILWFLEVFTIILTLFIPIFFIFSSFSFFFFRKFNVKIANK